jgi:DNA-binding CsgD family transcriptional regulator
MGVGSPRADLDRLVNDVYEAAIVPELWPKALAEMAGLADAAFASLLTFDGSVLRWTGTPEAIDLIDSFKTVEATIPNCRILAAIHKKPFGFITDADLFTDDEIERDPFYTEFLRPRGYGWMVGNVFDAPTGELIAISAERRFDRGPVERRYVTALDRMRPHYARAAMLAARLGLERAAAMTKVLDLLRLPAAVLQESGALFAANESFCQLIPSIFEDRRARLAAKDERADALVAAALASRKVGARSVQSIPLQATTDGAPMVVHLLPVCGVARDIFARGVTIVVVTPISRRDAPQASVLQSLFDLTPGEARVAKGLAEALSPDVIALHLGLSRETVRTRVKSTLSKTGLHRQSELANLLAGLPGAG